MFLDNQEPLNEMKREISVELNTKEIKGIQQLRTINNFCLSDIVINKKLLTFII